MSQQFSQGLDAYARPVAYASEHDRASFLRNIALWTLGGLTVAFGTGAIWAVVVAVVGGVLLNQWVMMGIIFGSFYGAQSIAQRMVFGQSKVPGFLLGMVAQGVAMGYILLFATLVGADRFGVGPQAFAIIGQAGVLTGITVASMVAYLWTAPKDLSMIGAGLRVLFVPMLILMVISFVFPIGGVFGMGISVFFVGVSGAGLLYQLNQVMHTMRADMHIEGAYTVSLGMLVLFWNLLSLLMRLQSRD